jgi:hypothetical protein
MVAEKSQLQEQMKLIVESLNCLAIRLWPLVLAKEGGQLSLCCFLLMHFAPVETISLYLNRLTGMKGMQGIK